MDIWAVGLRLKILFPEPEMFFQHLLYSVTVKQTILKYMPWKSPVKILELCIGLICLVIRRLPNPRHFLKKYSASTIMNSTGILSHRLSILTSIKPHATRDKINKSPILYRGFIYLKIYKKEKD